MSDFLRRLVDRGAVTTMSKPAIAERPRRVTSDESLVSDTTIEADMEILARPVRPVPPERGTTRAHNVDRIGTVLPDVGERVASQPTTARVARKASTSAAAVASEQRQPVERPKPDPSPHAASLHEAPRATTPPRRTGAPAVRPLERVRPRMEETHGDAARIRDGGEQRARRDQPASRTESAPGTQRADVEQSDATDTQSFMAPAPRRPPTSRDREMPRIHPAPAPSASDALTTTRATNVPNAADAHARLANEARADAADPTAPRARPSNEVAPLPSIIRELEPTRSVTVHIGTIEIVAASAPVAAAPSKSPPPRSPSFEEFTALRMYAPWPGR